MKPSFIRKTWINIFLFDPTDYPTDDEILRGTARNSALVSRKARRLDTSLFLSRQFQIQYGGADGGQCGD